jgi:alcohol dehydrogenase
MKSWQITGYGTVRENLALKEVSEPVVKPGEVLIEIRSASLNPVDFKIVKGDLKRVQKLEFPSPIGYDASGVVKQVGSGVSKFKVGDEVYARASRESIGTFAEYIALNEDLVSLKPRNFNHRQAASIPLIGLTTYQALIEKAQAKKGQTILIHAGSGGVGTFAIQFAKAVGLRVATTTSQKNEAFVRSLGADEVICYDRENYLERAQTFDIVYDLLGGEFTTDAFLVLNDGGVVVSIAGVPDKEFARRENVSPVTRIGIWFMNRRVYQAAKRKNASYFRFLTESSGRQLSEIAGMIEAGKIRAVIDKEFNLNEIVEALEYLEKGRARGKIIINVR